MASAKYPRRKFQAVSVQPGTQFLVLRLPGSRICRVICGPTSFNYARAYPKVGDSQSGHKEVIVYIRKERIDQHIIEQALCELKAIEGLKSLQNLSVKKDPVLRPAVSS